MSANGLAQAAAGLLAPLGWGALRRLEPLAGGANNQVFRVEAEHGTALLKAYFQHAQDPRDRLGAEFAFCRFAWDHGVRALPRPLACDREHGLGLFEFVPGRALRAEEVDEAAVHEALDFYDALNRHREHEEAKTLPRASEACFSVAEHLATVASRVQRLQGCTGTTACEREMQAFVRSELLTAWERVEKDVRCHSEGLDHPLAEADRCLSPSDFGFHNALRGDDGRLRFLDFEYAGWDDPAKLIGDFFCQPALPVPAHCYEDFVQRVCANLTEPELQRQRADLLLPVYRIKWCCILLNDFLPVGSTRRRFASADVDPEERKARQLLKARRALDQMSASPQA